MVHILVCTVTLCEENMVRSIFQMYLAMKRLFSHRSSGNARIPQVTLWETMVNRLKSTLLFSGGPKKWWREGPSPLKSRRTMIEGSPLEMVPLPGFHLPAKAASWVAANESPDCCGSWLQNPGPRVHQPQLPFHPGPADLQRWAVGQLCNARDGHGALSFLPSCFSEQKCWSRPSFRLPPYFCFSASASREVAARLEEQNCPSQESQIWIFLSWTQFPHL